MLVSVYHLIVTSVVTKIVKCVRATGLISDLIQVFLY